MGRQVLCYVQRKRISDWKRLVCASSEPAFVYGSNAGKIFSGLRPGDTLWVASPVPGRPPELVARLNIRACAPFGEGLEGVSAALLSHFREFEWVAVGGEESVFFGHNDAGGALLQTVFTSQSGKTWQISPGSSEWEGRFGGKFEQPRLVSDSRALEQVSRRPQVFISWKWSDHWEHLAQVFALAYALARAGFMPWLDKLALPASRATREKIDPNPLVLQNLLAYGYRHCQVLLALESGQYGVKSPESDENWTLREWDGSLAGKDMPARVVYRAAYAGESRVTAGADYRLESREPVQAALELQKWFEEKQPGSFE